MVKADTYTVPVGEREFLWPAWLDASLGSSDSVVWADLLGLTRQLFTLSALSLSLSLSLKARVSVLTKILPLNMGVKVVPKIFGANGPKITQRQPRPRAHNYMLEKGQQRSNFRFATKSKEEMSINVL